MNIIIDATAQRGYPVGKPADFYGGTELMLHKVAAGLAKNHTVHVITPDLGVMEHRANTLFYWPPEGHPKAADAVVMIHNLANIDPYSADLLILASNGIGAYLGPNDEFAQGVDAVACFSETHVNLLTHQHPKIDREKCFITGLGVDLNDYVLTKGLDCPTCDNYERLHSKVPGRFLYANAPERGLWTTLKIFERIQDEIPHASLHISYDWRRVFEGNKWSANAIAQQLWECDEMIRRIPNVKDLGALTREQVVKEQLQCQIHLYPSAPPNIGSQIHGITQMECAAAGCALVLSDTEAFPEIFSAGASILPVPGAFLPEEERRCTIEDWKEEAIYLIRYPEIWQIKSQEARALAEQHTWDRVVENWEAMLLKLTTPLLAEINETIIETEGELVGAD